MVIINKEDRIRTIIEKYQNEHGKDIKYTVGKDQIHFEWKTSIDGISQYEVVMI